MGDTTKLLPLLTWRAAICDSSLPPASRHVALALSLWMNERGGSAFPGALRLAHATGMSERSIREHLGTLVRSGWLDLAQRGGGRTRANAYQARINMDDLTPYVKPAESAGNPENPADDDMETLQIATENPAGAAPHLFKNSEENSPLASAPRPRKEDALFNAVCSACAINVDELNTASRGPLNAAIKALRESGADPIEVIKRVQVLRLRYPNAAVTAPSLAKHWASLGKGWNAPQPVEGERVDWESLMDGPA